MLIRRSPVTRTVCQIVVTLVAVPFALPLVVIIAASFEGAGAWANYSAVLTKTPFIRSLFNSVVISLCVIALVFVCTMLAGYAFGKMQFTGKKLVFNAILAGLVLPSIVLIMPLFMMVQFFGLFDSYISVVLPLASTIVPFTLLLTRNYIMGIPDEVLEAARLDGCTSFGALVRVVLPLSRPITAVIIVWAFLQAWNEFFLPLVLFQDASMQTLTTIPMYFTSAYGSDQPKIFAALVLISLPIVTAYLCLQKFFEKGLSAGAIK